MHFKKKILSYIVLTILANMAHSNSFSKSVLGRWCWELDSAISAFSLDITKSKKNSNLYIGSYYAVAYHGDKIDDNEKAFYFKNTTGNIIKAKIRTGISGAMGAIQLKFLDNKVEWLVTRFPDGEFYVPEKAIMKRC